MNRTSINRRGRRSPGMSRRSTFSHSIPRRGKFHGSRPLGRGDSSARNNRPGFRAGGQASRQNRRARKMPVFDPSQFINANPVEATEELYTPKHSFGSFGLHAQLVSTIQSIGLVSPTPIQDQIIPEILAGRDVVGLAETGTGKTAAFLIPLIEKNLKNPRRQTLILAPTHELAIQIGEELRTLSAEFQIFSVICVGGINIRPQIKVLRKTNQFIIGTPGRILDLLRNNHFKPEGITAIVLDEADRMLDMGFIPSIRTILSLLPTQREMLLFSATMPADTHRLVNDFLHNPITVSVKKRDIIQSIEQQTVHYEHHNKFDTLRALLSKPECKRVLIFGSMKHSVQKLAHQLSEGGVSAEAIHGNKSHAQRQRSLLKFKKGEAHVLVATDVAARGIHVEDITHVINYDLPSTFEDYVHRIGRTGRATKRGKALTFVQKSH